MRAGSAGEDRRGPSGGGSSSSKLDSVTSAPWLQAAAMIPLLYLGSSDYCRCVYAALTKAEMEQHASTHFQHQARYISVVNQAVRVDEIKWHCFNLLLPLLHREKQELYHVLSVKKRNKGKEA